MTDGHPTVAFLVLVHHGNNAATILRPAYRRYVDAKERAKQEFDSQTLTNSNTLSIEIRRIGVQP